MTNKFHSEANTKYLLKKLGLQLARYQTGDAAKSLK